VADFTIVLGTRIWSTWSMRPWLVLRRTGASFDERLLRLRSEGTAASIREFSPSGFVPCLIDHRQAEPLTVWDSLAICEYLAESFPGARLWPDDAAARAVARSVSAEMHSGFQRLRKFMPMDLFADKPGEGLAEEGVAADVERIDTIWRQCRSRFGRGGPYLFGDFSIADAMFAPVASRFRTYRPPISAAAMQYVETLTHDDGFRAWEAAARAEL
jgi:glutathione S-transferase